MADAVIERLDPRDLATVTHLYNTIFRPERDEAWIRNRMRGRHNILVMVARIEKDAVGFYVGFELKPGTHFTWLVGVVSDLRRSGIASQLMHGAEEWCRTEGYGRLRFECDNRIRPFLIFGIANSYDIVGIRWDQDRMSNLIIFEKGLGGPADTR